MQSNGEQRFQIIDILGFPVANVDMSEAVAAALRLSKRGSMARVVTANAEIMYHSHRDPAIGKLLREADLIIPDGIGVVKASAMLGRPLKTRVAGADLTLELAALAAAKGYSIYLLGASRESLTGAVAALKQKHPSLNIAGCHDGYFNAEQKEAILLEIQEKKPDFLFIGMGFPAEHRFASENRDRLSGGVMIGVGGTIDALSGKVKRAPLWARRLNLEWAYRFAQNPRRLKRFWALPGFMLAAYSQKRAESRARAKEN